MAAKSTHRTSLHRTRTVVVGAALAAGSIAGALAVGGSAFADSPTTGTSATARQAFDTMVSQEAAAKTFADAGYSHYDGVALARQWKIADPFDAEATAGKKLAAGQTLPIKPGSTSSRTP